MRKILLVLGIALITVASQGQSLKGYTLGEKYELLPNNQATTVGGVDGFLLSGATDNNQLYILGFIAPTVETETFKVLLDAIKLKYKIDLPVISNSDGIKARKSVKEGVEYNVVTTKGDIDTYLIVFSLINKKLQKEVDDKEKEAINNDF